MTGMLKGPRPYDSIEMPSLTVSDVIKLAAGGVAIKFEDIGARLVPDPEPPSKIHRWWDTAPAEAMVARLTMHMRATATDNLNMGSMPLDPAHMYNGLMARAFGDAVYVFVCHRGAEPQIIKDPLHMFPSDALMAQLHLLEEHVKATIEGALQR